MDDIATITALTAKDTIVKDYLDNNFFNKETLEPDYMNKTVENLMKDLSVTNSIDSILSINEDPTIMKTFKLADKASKAYDILGEQIAALGSDAD